MKKRTQAQREKTSQAMKAHWAARKKRDVRSTDVAAISGGTASTTYASANQVLAIDVVKLIAHDVPADVIVKVVERILNGLTLTTVAHPRLP